MKRTLWSLFLTVVMWQLFASVAQSQIPQPVGPLRIVDSTGKTVGPVIDLVAGPPTTVIRVGSLQFLIGVLKDGLISRNFQNRIYFQLSNCQGQPYLIVGSTADSLSGEFLDHGEIVGSRMSLYGDASGGTIAQRTMNTYLDRTGSCNILDPVFGTAFYVEAARIVDLADFFLPPFALQEAAAPLAAASVPMLGWPELVVLSLVMVAALGVLRTKGRDKHRSARSAEVKG